MGNEHVIGVIRRIPGSETDESADALETMAISGCGGHSLALLSIREVRKGNSDRVPPDVDFVVLQNLPDFWDTIRWKEVLWIVQAFI
jgi:hypothetical protein